MLIGLHGVAKSGKDTVGAYLVEARKFNRHGFADKLKELALETNPLIESDFEEAVEKACTSPNIWTIRRAEKSERTVGYATLKSIVDDVGWDLAKNIDDVREYLQDLGLGARNTFGKDFWVDQLFNELIAKYDIYGSGMPYKMNLQSNVVITDCRFTNEAERIKSYNGVIVHVDRGLPPVNGHESENKLPPHLINYHLVNNGTLEDLYIKVDGLIETIEKCKYDDNTTTGIEGN